MEHLDFYELLQVSPKANAEAIRREYRLLAERWHPDRHTGGDWQRFRQLHEAFLVLSDPMRRGLYDAHRGRP